MKKGTKAHIRVENSTGRSGRMDTCPKLDTIEAVQCSVCYKLHKADSTTYLRFVGALFKGAGGGLIGGMPSEDGTPHSCCYCPQCFANEVLTVLDLPSIQSKRSATTVCTDPPMF